MMRKTMFAALAIGVSAAIAPAPATATCSTGSLQVCASVSAFYGGNGHLYIRAWNLFGSGGVSHVMTWVGIGSSTWSGTASLVATRFNGNLVSTWKIANGQPNNLVTGEIDFWGQTKNGVNNGLVGCGAGTIANRYTTSCNPPGGPYLELEFTTSSQIDLSTAIYGWHSQDVNGTDCSVWADSNGNLVGGTGNCNVVPEPISMILLGTGLAGVGGFGAIRRRKKDDEIV